MTTTDLTDSMRTEATEVLRWRLRRLAAAGYCYRDAVQLAVNGEVDLHRAVDLVARGCPADTAARILL